MQNAVECLNKLATKIANIYREGLLCLILFIKLYHIYAFALVSHCSHKVCLRQFCAPSLLRLGVQQAGGAKVAPSTVVSYAIESSPLLYSTKSPKTALY